MSDHLHRRSIDLNRVSMTEKENLEGKEGRISIPVASVDHIKHYNGKVGPSLIGGGLEQPSLPSSYYWMYTYLA